jgi:hypothetical protein
MLDTSFPRPAGDIGNPASFDHPVIYRRLPGAVVSRIVRDEPLPDDLVDHFIAQAHALEKDGATIITTSCGFLSPLQQRIQAAVTVPIITSSLCILPTLREQLGPDAPIGILTFDATRLSTHHIPDDGPIFVEGLLATDHLYQVISNDHSYLDQARAQNNVDAAIERLIQRQSNLRALILECTNLPPYRHKALKNFKFQTFDILDAIKHLQNVNKL